VSNFTYHSLVNELLISFNYRMNFFGH